MIIPLVSKQARDLGATPTMAGVLGLYGENFITLCGKNSKSNSMTMNAE